MEEPVIADLIGAAYDDRLSHSLQETNIMDEHS